MISSAAGASHASTDAIGKNRSGMAAWSRRGRGCYVRHEDGLVSSSRTTLCPPRPGFAHGRRKSD
jgi:hypothetical protein